MPHLPKRVHHRDALPDEAILHVFGKQQSATGFGRRGVRAVGAVVVSPALQRGVGETGNLSGVP
jgi:hypothetical protein